MSADFWDRLADRYAAMPLRDPDAHAEKLRRTQAILPEGARVLEMGCGTGSVALEHAPRCADYLATDFSARMLEIAGEKAAAAAIPALRFEQAAVADLVGRDDTFDAVLALSLLHLLPDPEAAMRVARARLVPGGYFVTNTWLVPELSLKVRVILRLLQFLGKVPKMTPMTLEAFTKMLDGSGFDVTETWAPKRDSAVFIIARARD